MRFGRSIHRMSMVRHNKKIFYSILGVNYIAILIYNFLTPPMSDDLYWKPGVYTSFSEILCDSWAYYNNWLGRIESYIFTRLADAHPKPLYNVISSLFFIALIFALYCNVEREEKYDCRTLSFISLYIWIWGIDFAQTMLWVCGTCNYLWCFAIEFGFLAYYRHVLKSADSRQYVSVGRRVFTIIGIFVWGLLAGNGNESSSGGVFLLVMYFTLISALKKSNGSYKLLVRIRNNIDAVEVSGILGLVLGMIIMVFAPGNMIRGAVSVEEESQTGLLLYLGRFIKINNIIYDYMQILIATIVILLVYIHIYKGKRVKDMIDIYAYVSIAIISIYVIILTTIPMPRAFMGGSLILLIAAIQLIQYIEKDDKVLNTACISAVILMTLYMLHSYVCNAANLVRILRELEERQEYVDTQKEAGNYSLELPMLRKEWDNRYTYIYHKNDVNEEPDSFGNQIYRIYYGLDEVIGIPWEEWEEKQH